MRRDKSSWQSQQFGEQDTDPLVGFANIMDVMLVFALGLMLALIAQSEQLQQHLNVVDKTQGQQQTIQLGEELVEAPESIDQAINGKANGMQSLGQVYRDPKTGKLILISGE